MQINYVRILAATLTFEGGFSNHPKDPGGRTLEGITQSVYDRFRAKMGKVRQLLVASMRKSSEWIYERNLIYSTGYWLPMACDRLPAGPDAEGFDYAVNSGPGRAARVIAHLVGVDAKTMTPEVIAAVKKRDPAKLAKAINDERQAFLRRLPTWPTFGAGWKRRVDAIGKLSAQLAREGLLAAGGAPKPATVPSPAPAPEPAPGDNMSSGKATLPAPTGKITTTAGGSAAGGAGVTAGWWDWITAHPTQSVIIGVFVVVAVAGVVYIIWDHWKDQSTKPVEGFEVLPEVA